MAVNPDTVAAQIEGGTIFGLTAALHGAITLKDGRVEQSNFDTYLPMRIDEVPVIETHLVASAEAPGGIGETADRRHRAGDDERHLRRDRQAHPHSADRHQPGEPGMILMGATNTRAARRPARSGALLIEAARL